MADVVGLLDDLVAEGESLDAVVSTLDESGWRTATPAEGWTVGHQVGHLAWTDQAALLAATDVDAFSALVRAAIEDPAGYVNVAAERQAALPGAELLAAWRRGRVELVAALRGVPDGTKLPWFGPPMAVASMATARLMETWAHGQDIVDGLGVSRVPTGRLRHVAHIGVRTIGFAFAVHGLDAPEVPFRVELTGPGGESWVWGPEDSPDRVAGSALDFCFLVTQRRHPDDLDLTVSGAKATAWVPIAQAFAGPPGGGRKPGQAA
jgi:uncharacterized protein (TIGR03084 family)